MVRLQYPSVKFFMVRSPNKSGFPACFKRAGEGNRNAAGRQNAAPPQSLEPLPQAPRRWNYTTAFILLRRRFLVQIRPTLKRSFCVRFLSSHRRRKPSGTSPVLRTAPPKNSPKNFWKGDNSCHVFCAIIETKENTHARNQSL